MIETKTDRQHSAPCKKIRFVAMILVLVFAALYVPAKFFAVKYSNAGTRLYEQGRYEEAVVQYRRALRIYPGFKPARTQLAELEKFLREEPYRLDVRFIPTPREAVDKMLEMAKVTKDDLLYDLGCGDGRIVVTAAKRYGCKAVGYDIHPQRIKDSLENVRRNKLGHLVRIEQADIFTLDLSEATVITIYLLPELNVRLIPQLEKLKPGSRIVSHDFDMKGVEPDEVATVIAKKDGSEHKVYLWTTPLKKIEVKESPAESPKTKKAPSTVPAK